MDVRAVASAIAARYAPGVLSTPTGAAAIRSSSGLSPERIGAYPAMIVSSDEGTVRVGEGSRLITARWFARLYYSDAASGDLERDITQLEDWTSVLLEAHKVSVQLGGLAAYVRTSSWKIGQLRFAGITYNGVELRLESVHTDGWQPTA